MRAYPGPRGRTGWIFSNVAFNDLVRQLTYESGDPDVRLRGGNREALETVDAWLAMPAPGQRPLSPVATGSATGAAGGL
jgi:hypothetical protein